MNAPRILLVEGKTDQYVIPEVCELGGFLWTRPPETKPHVRIRVAGSDEELLELLAVALKSNHEALGVVLDADTDPQGRWGALQAVYERVRGARWTQSNDGVVVDGPPRFGAWVMPDNRTIGMLEDLVATMCASNPDLRKHCEDAVDHAKALGADYKPIHRSKAVVHTWLAWLDEPGSGIGSALKYRKLGTPSPEVLTFVHWFTRLFG
jgi:hypothetical protein